MKNVFNIITESVLLLSPSIIQDLDIFYLSKMGHLNMTI